MFTIWISKIRGVRLVNYRQWTKEELLDLIDIRLTRKATYEECKAVMWRRWSRSRTSTDEKLRWLSRNQDKVLKLLEEPRQHLLKPTAFNKKWTIHHIKTLIALTRIKWPWALIAEYLTNNTTTDKSVKFTKIGCMRRWHRVKELSLKEKKELFKELKKVDPIKRLNKRWSDKEIAYGYHLRHNLGYGQNRIAQALGYGRGNLKGEQCAGLVRYLDNKKEEARGYFVRHHLALGIISDAEKSLD